MHCQPVGVEKSKIEKLWEAVSEVYLCHLLLQINLILIFFII